MAEKYDFPGERSSSSSLTYPKTTEGALRELRLRGLKCDAATLLGLVERGVVRPAGREPDLQWTKGDIDAAAEWLYENGHWDSWTQFYRVCNLRFGQCVEADRVASARFGWGFSLSFDLLRCASVIEPPEEPDGYAFIRFFSRKPRSLRRGRAMSMAGRCEEKAAKAAADGKDSRCVYARIARF